MSTPNIAFIGKAGAGKTTCAEILVKQYGYTKAAFAEGLKVMLDTGTDRDRLQEFGTDVVRKYEPDAWVRLFFLLKSLREQAYEQRSIPPALWTVDDCRFPNEAYALKAEGFVIVRVVAPTTTRVNRLQANGKLQDVAQLEHVSETALDDFPHAYRIVNDGWSTDLEADIQHLLRQVSR